MAMEERTAAGFLPPTATGPQALLRLAAGTSVQDLNALWGGMRDRWRDKTAWITVRSVGGLILARMLYPGETGGATATNAVEIADGEFASWLVTSAVSRLDYTATGDVKLWQSSVAF